MALELSLNAGDGNDQIGMPLRIVPTVKKPENAQSSADVKKVLTQQGNKTTVYPVRKVRTGDLMQQKPLQQEVGCGGTCGATVVNDGVCPILLAPIGTGLTLNCRTFSTNDDTPSLNAEAVVDVNPITGQGLVIQKQRLRTFCAETLLPDNLLNVDLNRFFDVEI